MRYHAHESVTDARTHGRTDGLTDGQPKNIMPPSTKLSGGIKMAPFTFWTPESIKFTIPNFFIHANMCPVQVYNCRNFFMIPSIDAKMRLNYVT